MANSDPGPPGLVPRLSLFMQEVWRRKVVQTAAAYVVAGWVVIEGASVVLPAFDAPPVILQAVIVTVALGLPVILVLSWIYDVTTRGVVRTDDGDEADESVVEEPTDELEIQSVRRQVTALCACIDIGSDTDAVDPEDLLELEPQAMELANKVFARYGGHAVPSRPGELLVYFGFPVAQEEATRNAVRAGLGLVSGISRFNDREAARAGVTVACRATVHTGEVVVEMPSAGDDTEARIVGTLPTETARILERSAQGAVVLSEAALRNVRGLFQAEPLSDGDAPAERNLYRVTFESGARNRLEAMGDEDLLPLVGRNVELSQLDQAWKRSLDGQGQVALVSGSAGMGKSRIVHAFKKAVAENPQAWTWELYCEPMSQDTALFPVVEFLREGILGIDDAQAADDALARVEGLLAEYDQDLQETVPLLAALLGVPLGGDYKPSSATPQRQRQALIQLLIDLVTMRAKRQPLLFVAEDVHWADSTTMELIGVLIEQVPVSRIMVVVTYRHPFETPWRNASHISTLSIAGLDSAAAEEVCHSISADIPAPVIARITDRADGVPLFIEEVTKALVESGAFGKEPDDARVQRLIEELIPDTLRDALTARLDRLGKARDVAQLGAAIGRDFSHRLIAEVADELKARRLDDYLEQLVEPEILLRAGMGHRTTYRFKHKLIQDAAYHTLIRKQRKLFHAAIARVLEDGFPDIAANNPGILALHFAASDQPQKAIDYRLKAAAQAMLTAATSEAMANLHAGLELLEQIPAGPERDLHELSLRTVLGSASMFAFGYASAEAHAAYSRAEALCGPEVPLQHAVPVVMGLSAYHSVRGAAREGQLQNQRILEMAEATGDETLMLWGHAFACVGNFYEGNFAASKDDLEHVLSLYDLDKHRDLSAATSQDPKVFAMAHAAQSIWALGDSEAALELAAERDRLAEEIGHPLVLQQSLGWGNIVFLYCGQPDVVVEKSCRAHDIAAEQNIPFYVGANLVWWGAGLSRQGDHDAGVAKMRDGLDMLEGTGAKIGRPMMLTLVAEALGDAGRAAEGLEPIAEALAQVEQWGECFYLAETLRVNGLLKHKLGKTEEAGDDLRRAVDTARAQGAVSFQSMAEASLAAVEQN